MDTTQLKRIADALDEILRLVKKDQEETKKYLEDEYVKLFENEEAKFLPPWDPMGALAK